MKKPNRPKYKPTVDSEDEEYFGNDYNSKTNSKTEDALANISFGALSKAGKELEAHQEEKNFNHRQIYRNGDREEENEEEEYDDDSAPEESSSVKKKHKHAPREMSSKKKVSVIREIPGLAKTPKTTSLYRDIRFDPAYGKADLQSTRKKYAFLDDYRQAEITELKEMLKGCTDNDQRLEIKQMIQGLESRLLTMANRDFEAKVLSQAPSNGKYLKRSEKKKLVLAEKFKTMKRKDVERAIERRRKKNAAKERKNMPMERRS